MELLYEIDQLLDAALLNAISKSMPRNAYSPFYLYDSVLGISKSDFHSFQNILRS